MSSDYSIYAVWLLCSLIESYSDKLFLFLLVQKKIFCLPPPTKRPEFMFLTLTWVVRKHLYVGIVCMCLKSSISNQSFAIFRICVIYQCFFCIEDYSGRLFEVVQFICMGRDYCRECNVFANSRHLVIPWPGIKKKGNSLDLYNIGYDSIEPSIQRILSIDSTACTMQL